MTDKLAKVLDLLIAEDKDEAAKALNEWFAEQQATLTASLMEAEEVAEDEELDESEEVTEDEEALEEGVTITIDTDGDDDVEVSEADDEFGGEDLGDEEIVDGDDAEAFGGEEEVAGDEVAADDSAVEDLTVDERVEDLEAQLDALRAEFDKLMGDESDEDGDEAGEEEIVDGDSEEEETEGDDDVDEAIAPGVPGKKTTFVQKSGIDFGGNQDIREDEELDEEFADLAEAADYKLEPVKAETLKKEGEQAGNGKKVKVDKDSPIPQRKPTERMGGDPVEIKGKTHKGYARETAPAVAGGNEKFKNSQKAPKKISKEGDKSAELNKNKEDKSTKSPINGDPKLRGNDLSRK